MIPPVLGIISANYENQSFRDLVKHRPVATLPFCARYRLIDFPLSNMVNSGITTVGLITPYSYRSIFDHVGVGKHWQLSKKTGGMFVMPGTVTGERTASSRFLISDIARNIRVIDRSKSNYILMCDCSNVMNIDYEEFIMDHIDSGCPVSIMYHKNSTTPGRRIRLEGKYVAGMDEDGDSIFMNTLIINRSFMYSLLEWYKNMANTDIVDILAQSLDTTNVNAYEYKGYVGIINTLDDYVKVSVDMFNDDIRNEVFNPDRPISTKDKDEAPTIVRESGNVDNAIIGSNCIIEGTVENSILFRKVKVGKNSTIKNSIVFQHVTIKDNVNLLHTIIDKNAVISDDVKLEGREDNPILIEKDREV